MTATTRKTIQILAAALLMLFALSAPALAHHRDGHANGGGNAGNSQAAKHQDKDGDADSDPETAYTEDNDNNDGGTPNNVADDGDNAHPSGKDRSVENGKSSNQGKAESDPDDDGRGPDRSNGGPDKPNGSGGVDKADQDGNNGCGNDDDFEDDNEGWCGGKPKAEKPDAPKPGNVKPDPSKPCDADATMPGVQECGSEPDEPSVLPVPPSVDGPKLDTDEGSPGGQVLGEVLTNEDRPAVAGAVAERGPLGAALPFTGGSVLGLLLAAGASILAGLGAMSLSGRKKH